MIWILLLAGTAAAPFAILALGAVALSAPAFAQDDAQLTDAVAFVWRGLEEGGVLGQGLPIVRRTEGGRVYYRIQPDTASSNYYEMTVSNPESCVFELGYIINGREGGTTRINLNNATRLEVVPYDDAQYGVGADIKFEGRDTTCRQDRCVDKDDPGLFIRGLGGKAPEVRRSLVGRYQKAVESIKARCPGRPQ